MGSIKQGRIVRGVGGFYYVETEEGTLQCQARGLFKKKGITPTVGDLATVTLTQGEEVEGYVTEILPRKNAFIRPPVANIDTFAIVVAAKNPDPHFNLLDRFLVAAELADTKIQLVFNKIDLDDGSLREKAQRIYGGVYPLHFVSCHTGEGLEELRESLNEGCTAFAGPSGVGKSSLLNHILGMDTAETGTISKKTGRGRHTTRHVELFKVGKGYLYDTPGFTSLEVPLAQEEELAELFPEMRPYLGECRFDNCRHVKEPDCRIRQAVEEGKLSNERYQSYLEQLAEVKKRVSWR